MPNGDDIDVVCAGCARRLVRSQTDIVEYGTGYRCDRCSRNAEAWVHVGNAIDEERRRSDEDLGTVAGPPLADVIAQVNAAQAAQWGAPAPPAPTGDVPPELPPLPPVGHAADRLDRVASSADPYRGGLAPTLRYVCIVCYRSASDLPGTCEHDGVPLLDLE